MSEKEKQRHKCPSCSERALYHIPVRYMYSCMNCGAEVSAEFMVFKKGITRETIMDTKSSGPKLAWVKPLM